MSRFLKPEDVAECITSLIARNKLWVGKKIIVSFIVNKKAGCFVNKRKSFYYEHLFSAELASLAGSPECTSSITYKILSTQYAGHARELAQAAVAEYIALDEPNSEMVIVTCGGDGTCLEVQESLYKEAQIEPKKKDAIMNGITLLRLPLGTGNDGTDGHSIQETFTLLKSQLMYKNAPAVKIYPERPLPEILTGTNEKNPAKYGDINYKAPWYAFNIVSIGLDAYVVYLSNVMRNTLPGEFYHLAVPLSGLLYKKDFAPGTATIEFFDDDDNKIDEITSKITLLAFGASGHRVYGGGQKVLPDDNNICFTKETSLLDVIKESKGYAKGLHFEGGISKPYTAHKIRISYDMPILLQSDGEVVMLAKDHFPLIMEKTKPCIRVLSRVE